MNAFERCVVDRDTFFAGQWRKAPAVMRPANPPVDLLTVADVDRLLDSGLLHVPYVEVTHESGAVPRERYCAPPGRWRAPWRPDTSTPAPSAT
ncbi:hypothetical protein ABZV80_23005 [Streptomyces sp. NPDC005132]|uniref:hypothetical protein n=1 Tax=Streptomyces sp. NPDC005132 TaxID=3154294 RepID=UPI0033B0232C